MYRKLIFLVSFITVLSLSASVQAVTVSFHTTAPMPGPHDVYNFIGATKDSDNVGTTSIDGATNDATTYVAFDRGSQGQFFVTGDSESAYQITGFWYQHCGYTENTNQTYWNLTSGNTLTARVTFPPATGTEDFIMTSETYTVTGDETNNFGVGPSANGTGTWVHAVFDTPVPVGPGTKYGVDMTAANGGFYETLGIKDTAANGNPYPDGTAYVSGAAGQASDTYTTAPGDRVFIIELIAQVPLKASVPNPAHTADNASWHPTLTWVPGRSAAEHVVYFGDNYDDVAEGAPSTYQGTVTEPSFNITSLTIGQTYYWRVDEVNESDIWTGDVWSFKVAPIISWNPSPYNDEVAVFTDPCTTFSWNPGTDTSESQLYLGTSSDSLALETTISHTGLSRYSYNKTGLANDQDYYWRVDQVIDGNTLAGDVWHFTTIPDIQITNPNLVGWWKFDEGPGKAIDWSGLGQHGTVFGDAQSAPGYDGDAIQFDGYDDLIQLPIGSTIAACDSITIMTWIDFSSEGDTGQRIFDFGNGNESGYMYLTPDNGTTMIFYIRTNAADVVSQIDAPYTLPTGWHNVAVSIDSATMNLQLYLDSESIASDLTQVLPSDLGNTTENWIGRSQWGAEAYLDASMDDFRIYNYALTQDEILKVMRGGALLAWNPRPANREVTDVEKALPLSWSPGDEAVQHDVYFGTDYAAVEAADASDTTGIYRGQQDANSYTPPEGVEPNHAYYWRINEINTDATVSKGRIWSFTVADYLIVDDFEDYEDIDNRIFDIWVDYFVNNTGMTVGYFDPPYAEQTIVHGGSQSMYMRYDNDGTVNEGTDYEQSGTLLYSEAERTWEIPQDWTREGVESLMLWFRGIPASVGSFTAGPPIMMTAAGTDIWGTADQFYFAYKRLSGGGSITARVVSVSNTDPWAKAGVMIRESLEPSSVNVMIAVTPGNGVTFQNRTSAGADSVSTVQAGITAPQWVRLTRSGNTFTADYSATGTANSWTTLGNIEMPMATDVYIGLCLTSHNVGATCTAEFSNVNITGTVTGDWQSQDIGIESNIAEQLYVVLEDSAGSSAVVNNSDPAATTIGIWTEWNIPLTDFAGVNMQAIKKMIIGVGDPSSPDPQPGGAGTLYIDDIGLKLPIQ